MDKTNSTTHNNGLTEKEVCLLLGVESIFFNVICTTRNTMSTIQSKMMRHIKKQGK